MEKLATLLRNSGMDSQSVPDDAAIGSLCYDSRSCREGSAFFAFDGIHTDGQDHIDDAIARGAVCVFSRTEPETRHKGVRYYTTANPRALFARMCAAFFHFPASRLKVIGVTGTDGKSTTCDYLYQLLRFQGVRVGMLGTVSMDDGSGKRPSPYRQSTPEADILQNFLRRCADNGLTHVILECTSHALSRQYDRLATVAYDLAIVTTVTSEHLEFHKTLEAYVDAKCNLVRNLKKGMPLVSTTTNPALDRFLSCLADEKQAHILHRDIPLQITEEGCGRFTCDTGSCSVTVGTGLACMAENAMLAATAAALLSDIPLASVMPMLSDLETVPGRMVTVENRLGLQIVIDFAHTPDAYANLFPAVSRQHTGGKIIAVFGCAGERDTTKRRPMGRIAATYSSHIILTEEDPRQEGNESVFADILKGIAEAPPPTPTVELAEDRNEAIARAFAAARRGDTLLFLGKGHEQSIERAEGKIPWDEEKAVRAELARITETEEKIRCT